MAYLWGSWQFVDDIQQTLITELRGHTTFFSRHKCNMCNLAEHVQWLACARARAASMATFMFKESTPCWQDIYVPSLDRDTSAAIDNEVANDTPTAVANVSFTAAANTVLPCTPRAWQLAAVSAVSWAPFLLGMGIPQMPGRRGPSTSAAGRTYVAQVVASMRDSGLVSSCGLLNATTVCSGEQWDAPNCWPPLVCMWVDGLMQHGGESGKLLANKLGHAYLRAVNKGLQQSGMVWEKYSTLSGGTGTGGEYAAQVGFGWSNGVALHLIAACGMLL
jgi:alpha,alpha-trehalase